MSDRFTLCLDFGGTKLAAGVVDLSALQLIDSAFSATRGDANAAVADMLALANSLRGVDRVSSIGISFGGYAADNNIIKSLHVPGWDHFPIRNHLRWRFGDLPVYVANDANAVGLSEWKFGAGRGSSSMLFVTVSTGVGGSLILNNTLLEGRNGLAGEIGHMNAIPEGGPACACGRFGCVEAVAAGPSMVKYARRLLNDHPNAPSRLRQRDEFTAHDINQDAHQGDELAAKVLRTGARYLGIAIGNTINLLDLECVVIGGGVSRAGSLWWNALREAVNATVLPWRPEVAVKPSQLGAHEGIWGAAALVPDI